MKKLIVKSQPIVWIAAIMFSVFLTLGCTNTTDQEVKKDSVVMPVVTTPSIVNPGDSLPPIDPSATSRPAGVKSVQ